MLGSFLILKQINLELPIASSYFHSRATSFITVFPVNHIAIHVCFEKFGRHRYVFYIYSSKKFPNNNDHIFIFITHGVVVVLSLAAGWMICVLLMIPKANFCPTVHLFLIF